MDDGFRLLKFLREARAIYKNTPIFSPAEGEGLPNFEPGTVFDKTCIAIDLDSVPWHINPNLGFFKRIDPSSN